MIEDNWSVIKPTNGTGRWFKISDASNNNIIKKIMSSGGTPIKFVQEVGTLADRDAIPADKRVEGMQVIVTNNPVNSNTTNGRYTLKADLTTWTTSMSFGTTRVTGADAFAAGKNNNVQSSYGVAMGLQNTVTGVTGVTLGFNNVVTGQSATAFGETNSATAQGAFVCNQMNQASGISSFAAGTYNKASGYSSMAYGYESEASGSFSTARGSYTNAVGANSFASGAGVSSTDRLKASGASSFNHSRNTNANVLGAVASDSAILGGLNQTINNSAVNSAIIGGSSNVIASTALRSVILGGQNITANVADTVYVPNLEVATNGKITMKSPNGTKYYITLSDSGSFDITAA
jgi:hypothetical protein